MAAMQAQSVRLPRSSSTDMSRRIFLPRLEGEAAEPATYHTFSPAIRHKPSTSTALLLFNAVSRSVDICRIRSSSFAFAERERAACVGGNAMSKETRPSFGFAGEGLAISAATTARTLVWPSIQVTESFWEKDSDRDRESSSPRPSSLSGSIDRTNLLLSFGDKQKVSKI